MSASQLQPLSGSRRNPDNVAPLDVVIRFSASIADLHISVPGNPDPTTATLKLLIRASLPAELRARRIRLIYAGKALEDGSLLSGSIKRQTPSRTGTPGSRETHENVAASAKGKEPVRDPPAHTHVYIHCSIGDVVLTKHELAEEETLAKRHARPDDTDHGSRGQRSGNDGTEGSDGANTTPAPRGFDRLLSAGFSAAEVQNLRLQFMAIQAHTHTPDTMPSPNTLRSMEDRWLDNSSNGNGIGGAGLAGGSDDDAAVGALDDMLWGAALGFFWPLGCLFWGFREEGIWSQRRKMAIVVGVVLNVGIGLIRFTS